MDAMQTMNAIHGASYMIEELGSKHFRLVKFIFEPFLVGVKLFLGIGLCCRAMREMCRSFETYIPYITNKLARGLKLLYFQSKGSGT